MKGRYSIFLGAFCLVPLLLFFLLGPVFSPDPLLMNLMERLRPPSLAHWLGTDSEGRDVLARVAHGGRLSLLIGLSCAVSSVGFGALAGMFAGMRKGWTDRVVMRGVEFLFAIPTLLIAVALSLAMAPGAMPVVLSLAVVSWAAPARIVRTLTLQLMERPFVEAARAVGVPPWRLGLRHLLPNLSGTLLILFSIQLAAAVLGESTLSFLGLGVQPPTPTLGRMILSGQDYLTEAPWGALAPGLMLAMLVLGVNFLGDGLRDMYDPHLKTR